MEAAKSMTAELNRSNNPEVEGDRQFLTFMLAGEEYGVDILRVQEIKGWEAVTPIPNTPDYIRGVMNLRGTIVPIIDMRRRFNLEAVEYGPITVVIVLKVNKSDSDGFRIMGIVVDTVSDVCNVHEDSIKPAPDFGSVVDVDFVQGLVTMDNSMKIILNIDRLLNSRELAIVNSDSE